MPVASHNVSSRGHDMRVIIHGYTGDIPPAEYEDIYHAERSGKQQLGNQCIESPSNPG